MKTPTLVIKTLLVAIPLLLFNSDMAISTSGYQKPLEKEAVTTVEPLQLQLLKVRREVQRGQIIMLQNAIQSKLNP